MYIATPLGLAYSIYLKTCDLVGVRINKLFNFLFLVISQYLQICNLTGIRINKLCNFLFLVVSQNLQICVIVLRLGTSKNDINSELAIFTTSHIQALKL